ncbi:MAG TPA: Re/Si-specific NAD(P)(+) transhydrogenase subunit alpha [Thermoanaerobaculia bacterium]|nr:Re/Si-specific NAD(P)(+) transhydrogenase subunit alpha [Thermoanaerobaculia bacterium]
MARIFVPQESRPGERRVAAVPETVKKLVAAGLEVEIQRDAGRAAGFADAAYEAAGATVADTPAHAIRRADVVLKITEPLVTEVDALRAGAILFALLDPYRNLPLVRRLAERGITSFALELVPRTTRAQAMDVLSSQASIAGYKAVLVGAARLGKHLPMMMTAAGTVQPARVVVLGAGVAGLQALATAKRLGAIVEVSDVRAAVKEQVESLGGRFIDLPELPTAEGEGGYAREVSADVLAQQRAILGERLAHADLVITTAQVPGKRAPVLMTRAMVEAMKPGAVVVDLAASTGGNCEVTRVDEEVVAAGVVVLGPSNLAATVPYDASLLFARNVFNLLTLLWDKKERRLTVPLDDEVVTGTLLTHAGEIRAEPIAALLADTAVRV